MYRVRVYVGFLVCFFSSCLAFFFVSHGKEGFVPAQVGKRLRDDRKPSKMKHESKPPTKSAASGGGTEDGFQGGGGGGGGVAEGTWNGGGSNSSRNFGEGYAAKGTKKEEKNNACLVRNRDPL